MNIRTLLLMTLISLCLHGTMSACRAEPVKQPVKPNRDLIVTAIRTGPGGTSLYTIQANHVELSRVLETLLHKAGDQFIIDQDVTGPITLSLKNLPLETILQNIEMAAKPPIQIEHGKILHIGRREPYFHPVMGGLGGGIGGFGGVGAGMPISGAVGTASSPSGGALSAYDRINTIQSQQSNLTALRQNANMYLNKVNLDIPQSQSIPLRQALQTMEKQAQVPITVSKDIPESVQFSGKLIDTPISAAVEAIARTAGLKVVPQTDGALLLIPADRFRLFIDKVLIGSYPNHPLLYCTKCHYPLSPDWVVCPNCGQITPKGYELLKKEKSEVKKGNTTKNR